MITRDMRRFKIKLLSWEYWPQWIVYLPLGVYYLYLAMRARSFLFFSATNPGISTGGMFFESKWDVQQLMPQHLCPATFLVKEDEGVSSITQRMEDMALTYPVVAKPDRGGRGWCVEKIECKEQLVAYRKKVGVTFLVQAFVDHPVELSVFYVRHPASKKGRVSSVTFKKLLGVTGDGTSTVRELVLSNDRAYLQKEVLFMQMSQKILDSVPKMGEEVLLVPYGNHVRGAEFRDLKSAIDEKMEATFDAICENIPGFFYGRFDLRVPSMEDLKNGKGIVVLELNGTGAEPAHIYDPGYSFFAAQRDLCWHYKQMFDIAKFNKSMGDQFMTMRDYRKLKLMEKQYKQMVA